jgi:predicted DCC family thiol-disulfide oxidoreductase YuxK
MSITSGDLSPSVVREFAGSSSLSLSRQLANFYLRLDYRSLAAFRILISLVLIADWFLRWPDLGVFYTSSGVFPIGTGAYSGGGEFYFSPLDGAPSLITVRIIFSIGLLCYFLFLVGYKTKLFQCLSYLFFLSVCKRCSLISSGADLALKAVLIWTLFLPLNRRFAVDAFRKVVHNQTDWRTRRNRIAEDDSLSPPSIASLAVIIQIALIYFLAALDKSGDLWQSGTALYYALHVETFTTGFGRFVSNQPIWVIMMLTWGTLLLEYLAPVFLLLPVCQPALRRLGILAFYLMHIGIWATMQLGTFPFVMMASLVLLLSPVDWAALSRFARRWSHPVTAYYDADSGLGVVFCRIAAILDRGYNIQFIENSDIAKIPQDLETEHLKRGLLCVDEFGQRTSGIQAVAAIVRALPLPFRALSIFAPHTSSGVRNALYETIAQHRASFSRFVGLATHGVPESAANLRADLPTRPPYRSLIDNFCKVTREAALVLLLIAALTSAYNRNVVSEGGEQIKTPLLLRALVEYPGTQQGWNLFAPNPPSVDNWLVVDGAMTDGRRVDPLTGDVPDFSTPAEVKAQYGRYWRKYLTQITKDKFVNYRAALAKYVFTSYQKDHPERPQLSTLDFYRVYYAIPAPGGVDASPNVQRTLLGHYENTQQAPLLPGTQQNVSTPVVAAPH